MTTDKHRFRLRVTRISVAGMTALVLMTLFAPVTFAADNMGRKWVVNNEYGYYYRIAYHIDTDFPTAFRSRIYEGALQWNIDTHLYFERQTTANIRTDLYVYYVQSLWPFDSYCAAAMANGSSGTLTGASIRFPYVPCSSTWYTGTGTLPGGHIDAITVSVHEFGHTVELYHAYTPYANKPTAAMWPYIPTNPATKRYITQWDKDGVHAMYPTH